MFVDIRILRLTGTTVTRRTTRTVTTATTATGGVIHDCDETSWFRLTGGSRSGGSSRGGSGGGTESGDTRTITGVAIHVRRRRRMNL